LTDRQTDRCCQQELASNIVRCALKADGRTDLLLFVCGVQHYETRNSPEDEIANVNFLYDDIVHALQNTIDWCIIPPEIDAVICWNARLPKSVK